MALRQFASKCGNPVWSYLTTYKAGQVSLIINSTSRILKSATDKAAFPIKELKTTSSVLDNLNASSIISNPSFMSATTEKTAFPIKELKTTSSISNNRNASSIQSNPAFIDFIANNNLNKKFYAPTNTINSLKVYNDVNINPILIEDITSRIEILDPAPSQTVVKKEAIRMIQIRRRKMKKHKLQKLRKKMKFVFEKIRRRKELRIEQAFRTELLTQVEAADKFDAAEYVRNVLDTIRYQPKQRTVEEEVERRRQMKKVNKYQTTFVKPRFDY